MIYTQMLHDGVFLYYLKQIYMLPIMLSILILDKDLCIVFAGVLSEIWKNLAPYLYILTKVHRL